MATSQRKRRTTPATPDTPDTPATPEAPATSPTEQLVSAFWDAIAARDDATGTMPAVALDAVNVAYRAVPRRQRGDIVTTLTAEATDKVLRADGNVDSGLALALRHLSRAFATANASNGRERPPHDPVPEVAGILAALDSTRAQLLGGLSDEQHARLDEAVITETADATREKAMAKLAPMVKRALNGTGRRTNGNGDHANGNGRDLAELIRTSVSGSDQPVHLATIARNHDVSTGALANRWAKDNIDGVKAVDVDGRKAFTLA